MKSTLRLRASASAFATLLVFCGVDLGCDAGVECEAGETRECRCSPSCGYDRCGVCLGAGVGFSTDTCSAEGTWVTCGCQLEPEPECVDDSCEDDCSATMRAVLRQLPSGASEAECRAAFNDVVACGGPSCDEDYVLDGTCSAELATLDAACLGETHDCPAVL